MKKNKLLCVCVVPIYTKLLTIYLTTLLPLYKYTIQHYLNIDFW